MEPAEIVIIGGGWRSEFFLRVAREMPERFRVLGVLVRDAARGALIEKNFGVKTHRNLEDLLSAARPLFAIVSIARTAASLMLEELTNRKIPVLCETPPAGDLDGLAQVNALTARGGRIQVAEQYIFQPLHSARIAVAKSGLLGTISQAQVSYTHGYHAISLIRHYLGIGFESVKIAARRFHSPVIKGPDRSGRPREEKVISIAQTFATFEFADRSGVYDFETDQHRSYVRSDRILVRGERGEINQATVRHILDFRTPMEFELERLDTGVDTNMEGFFHRGIVGGGRYWYENPFPGPRFSDDEIAVATCMQKMADYARGGNDFYSLAEASHDQYLALTMEEAVTKRESIEAHSQPWAK